MELLQAHNVSCPHCWQRITVTLDLSEASQSYIEDCPVCCRAIAISYSSHDGVLDELIAESAE